MAKRRSSRRQSSGRSRAARRGWDTRTRRQGYRQMTKALAKRNPTISTAAFLKNMAIGSIKAAYPRKYRQSRLAKAIDRI